MTQPGSPSYSLALHPLGQRVSCGRDSQGRQGLALGRMASLALRAGGELSAELLDGRVTAWLPKRCFNPRGYVGSWRRLAQQKYGCNSNKLEKLQ